MAKTLNELTVLVVDDVVQARKLMKMVLNGLGVNQIFMAEDGKKALELIDASDGMIDMIICDWMMPHMTGLELLQQIRSVHSQMPFMMVTGRADLDSVKSAMTFNVNAYISKPYSPQQFEKKLLALAQQI